MKKSSKIITLCLTFVLLFAAVGGTLAWLTDKDEAENVFSVGSVDIELKETNAINGETVTKNNDGKYEFNGLMPGDVITKTPVISNIGKNDAYVRVVVEVENKGNLVDIMDKAIDQVYENKIGKDSDAYEAFYDGIFDDWRISYKKSSTTGNYIRFGMEPRKSDAQVLAIDSIRVMDDDGSWQFDVTNAFQSADEMQNVKNNFGGVAYINMGQKSYYADLMTAGEGKLIYVFYLKLDGKTESNIDAYTLFKGLNVPESFDAQSLAFFDGLEINIHADAIQTEGFEDTTAADGTTVPAWVNAINALNVQHPLKDLVAGK